MIYVIGNSVAFQCNPARSSYPVVELYPQIIDAILYPYCFSIRDAWWLFQDLVKKLSDDDVLVLNIGINDCIYRKDKTTQLAMLRTGLRIAMNRNDVSSIEVYEKKIKYVKEKPDDELFQFVTFEEFEWFVDQICKRLPCKGVLLSVNWIRKDDPTYDWAYYELEKTNDILKRKAEQYGLYYIDLWSDHIIRTSDSVHLLEKDHKYVAEKILEKLKESK